MFPGQLLHNRTEDNIYQNQDCMGQFKSTQISSAISKFDVELNEGVSCHLSLFWPIQSRCSLILEIKNH